MKYFIYYSLTGNGDYLASLYEKAGYRPIKVEMKKPIKKANFFTILKYGGRAMFNKKEKLQNLGVSITPIDEVIIGSPIWNDRLCTPISTLLRTIELNKETTHFVLYPAGEKTKKSLKQLNKLGFLNEPLVVSYPLKKQDETKKILGL